MKVIRLIVILIFICCINSCIKETNTNKSININSKNNGRIIYFPYIKGDFIKKNQTLAKIDNVKYIRLKNKEQALLYKYQTEKIKLENLSIKNKKDIIQKLCSIREKISLQKNKIALIDNKIKNNNIKAPFDCYITKKYTLAGFYIKKGSPLIEVTISKKN